MANGKPKKIEAVLLYRDFDTVDPRKILDSLNFVLENAKIQFEMKQAEADGSYCMMMGRGIYVQISQTHEPLALDGFAPALTSAHTSMIFPNAAVVVRHHKCRIFITVGSGVPVPGTEELEKKLEMPDLLSQGKFESMLTICQVLTRQMVRANKPQAIHWCQSDQIMTSDYFDKVSMDAFPMQLFVHPSYFSSRKEVNGTQVIGLRTYGAAHLIGKEVVFNEAPVPPGYLYARVVQFLEMARRSGEVIADGESFGESDREIIRVRHLPAEELDPNGRLELTLERSDAYGIGDVVLPGEAPLVEKLEVSFETAPSMPLESGPVYRPFQDEGNGEPKQTEEPVQHDEEAARKRAELLRSMRDKMRSEIEAPNEPAAQKSAGLLGGWGKKFRGKTN
ncbi:MAG: hypothetical protein LJE67_13775 [Salaquimonas sp.]|nr:hypothetical protein [Salaquimonas sp.]